MHYFDTLVTITLLGTKPYEKNRHCIQSEKEVNDIKATHINKHLPNFTCKAQTLV